MDLDRIVSELVDGARRRGVTGGVTGGVAAGLASSLLFSKAGRKLGKRALELGGLAAIAGVGYAAWRRHQAGGVPVAAPLRAVDAIPAAFLPPPAESGARDELGAVLLQAMIAAARADGKLDGEERRMLFEQLAKLELPEAERAELYAALERPVEIQTLIAAATTPERAVEIYTASLLAIDLDTPAERGYLAMLSAALGLPDGLVEQIHREVGVEPLSRAEGAA
jgi:uncharacterized membrane protein YebE (DUF533 family)